MQVRDLSWNEHVSRRFNHPLLPRSIRGVIVGKSGCGKTILLLNLLLRSGWLDYNKLAVFGKSLFQPEYRILKKAFEEKLPKEAIMRLFDLRDEVMKLDVSPSALVEEWAKEIQNKSDIECGFYESSEDVPDPSEMNSSNKNLMIFDDLLLEKQNKCESYYIRGRHSNVDCFYLSQNYFKLPRQTIRETQISYVYFPKTLKISTISTTITSVRTCQRSNLEVYVKRLGKILTGLSLSISLVKRTTGSTGKISTSFISYKKYRVHTKMEELLAKICKNTEPKGSRQIVVRSNKTRFNTRFNPPMQLDKNKKYEMALVNLETYYSFPNIDASNNYFRYSHDGGTTWVDIFIPEGSYDIVDINDTIQQKMRQNGHYDRVNEDYYITISANANTLKAVMILIIITKLILDKPTPFLACWDSITLFTPQTIKSLKM